ncbi:MAG: hypothetical protein NTY09_09525 [bacterium]|nr:hypothetical protein [bacterium]
MRADRDRDRPRGMHWFFNNDNPLWTMFPILLSILALFFAYKSTAINRAMADVHLRVTIQVFHGWINYDNYLFDDNVLLFRGTIGSLENLESMIDSLQLASNDMGMRWLAEAANMNPEDYNIEDMPYDQYFIFLAIKNDGDQIAEDLNINFDYYKVADDLALRGEEPIPEGIEPEDWLYGPALLAPGQWVMVPLGTCFIRFAPGSDEIQAKYMGDFYMPVDVAYKSAVAGVITRTLDFENIPKTLNSFVEPPMPVEGTDTSTDSTDTSGSNTSSRNTGNNGKVNLHANDTVDGVE